MRRLLPWRFRRWCHLMWYLLPWNLSTPSHCAVRLRLGSLVIEGCTCRKFFYASPPQGDMETFTVSACCLNDHLNGEWRRA